SAEGVGAVVGSVLRELIESSFSRGFFTCLSRDGSVYDELKYIWLQGRQIWTYCRLYRTLQRFRRPEILAAAVAGTHSNLRVQLAARFLN
ncbi:hypothetical protein chiPu_0029809, partial [Chiloscyllium punctatum]|nr:hypothetical protein [Chiloscyllium punctatum]